MNYFVYVIGNRRKSKLTTYVGYTKNLNKRLTLHNNSQGAKFTRGRKWEICYKEIYSNKVRAMAGEYKLKKDRKLRNFLKSQYIKKNGLTK